MFSCIFFSHEAKEVEKIIMLHTQVPFNQMPKNKVLSTRNLIFKINNQTSLVCFLYFHLHTSKASNLHTIIQVTVIALRVHANIIQHL